MESNVKAIIVIFLILMICVPLITMVANETDEGIAKDSTTNVTVDITLARCISAAAPCAGAASLGNHTNSSTTLAILTGVGRTDSDCQLTSVTLKNSTNTTIPSTAYNLTYTDVDGSVWMTIANATQVQDGAHSNTTYIDYSYCPTGYIVDGTSRTFAALFPLFFVLMIFGVAALFMWNRFKN